MNIKGLLYKVGCSSPELVEFDNFPVSLHLYLECDSVSIINESVFGKMVSVICLKHDSSVDSVVTAVYDSEYHDDDTSSNKPALCGDLVVCESDSSGNLISLSSRLIQVLSHCLSCYESEDGCRQCVLVLDKPA